MKYSVSRRAIAGIVSASAVEGVLADFGRRARRLADVTQAERKLRPTFEALLDELKGDGRSPDLLLNNYQTS